MFVESDDVVKQLAFGATMGSNNSAGSLTFNTFRRDIGTVPVVITGQLVDKVGRTTGWTRGTVVTTREDVLVNKGKPDEYLVLCGYKVEKGRALKGDSGAPVFINSSDFRPTGILFSGLCPEVGDCFYYYSEWDNIRLHLGRTLNPIPPSPALSASIIGPASVNPGTVCTWSVSRSGGTSPYQIHEAADPRPSIRPLVHASRAAGRRPTRGGAGAKVVLTDRPSPLSSRERCARTELRGRA